MVERAHGAKVAVTRCGTEWKREKRARVQGPLRNDRQFNVQGSAAPGAAHTCNPCGLFTCVCIRVSTRAASTRPPPFSVIFFPTQNLLLPRLIGGVFFFFFSYEEEIDRERNLNNRKEEKGIFDEKFTRGTISRIILSRFVCREEKRRHIMDERV